MSEDLKPADMDVTPPSRSPWRNLSLVWVVPVLALLVSLMVAWKAYSDRGVLIEISFENAAGIKAGETALRYREVTIGMVEKVGFSDDLKTVEVSVRVQKEVAPFINETAQFWVVRPEVSAEGVSGLSTVLSGVYIDSSWENTGAPAVESFVGLESRPLIDLNEKGTRITLRVSGGKIISGGVPIFYRGIRVGRTETPRLNKAGSAVLIDAMIEAPYDKYLTTATRFWDTSGFAVSLGAAGLKLDVGSFATLISGGVSFNTFFSGGAPVKPGQVYELYNDEDMARENAFSRVSSRTLTVATIFEEGVSGLSPGAALNFKGLKIGEVDTLSAFVSDDSDTPQVNQLVTFKVDPDLMGLPEGATTQEALDFIGQAVKGGVRARLNKASLLTSSLIVELVEIENAVPAVFDREAEPYPMIPSVETDLPDLNATMEGVMERINGLKIEELIARATGMMASIEAIASSEKVRAAPGEIVGLIEDARALVAGEAMQALPGDLRGVIEELRSTIAKANTENLVEQLVATLKRAEEAADSLYTAADDVPAVVAELRQVAAKVAGLKAEELLDAATGLMNSANALIDTDGARELPPALASALVEVRDLLGDLREGDAVSNVNVALSSAKDAAVSVETAVAGLPGVVNRLEGIVTEAEALIATYGARSDFNAETLAMLREVRTTARSIAALVRTLERSPNSILFGK
ncbi:MlaD family protein [Sedimentitalea sp. XS_ASV28]|uniref:MlaD family protein n=1 Tax=Sedimentitalea sp. XS_ASV28 TaxID=3241296 RepID=UPI0035187FBB